MAEGDLILSHQLKDPTYDGNTPTEAWIPLADLYKNNNQVNLYLRAKLDNGVVSADNLTTSAVTSNKIADNAITSSKIQTDAVTSNKIQNGAVSRTKIATNAVSTNNLINSAVTSDKIANGAITSNKIQNGAIAEYKILNGAVTSNKIANNNIINSHIAENTITLNKLDTQLKGVFIGSINPSLIENFAETFDIWGKDGITTIIQPEDEKVTINNNDFPAFELKLTSWLKYQAWEQKISLVNEFSYKIAYWDDNTELKYLEWTPNETPNIEGDSDYPEYYDTTSILLDTNDNNISIVDLFKNDSNYPIEQMFNSTWASTEQNIILTTLRNNLEDFITNADSGAYSVINQQMTKEKALLLGNGIVGKSTLGNFPIFGYSNSLWNYNAGSAAVDYKFLFEMYINSFQCGFTNSNYNLDIPSPPWWWQGARPDLIMSISIDDFLNTLGLSEIDYDKIGLWIEI